MKERILSIIRTKVKESEAAPPPYGFIQIGKERIDIRKPFINAGSTQEPIKGEISSNVSGVIEATHGPIHLTIKPPTKEADIPTKEGQHAYQEIGDKPKADAKTERSLRDYLDWFPKTQKKMDDIINEGHTNLEKKLMSLSLSDIAWAVLFITTAMERKTSLEKTKKSIEETLRRRVEKTTTLSDKLKVIATDGDITIELEDPDVAVVMREERTNPVTKGVAPENPNRIIELYLTHGIAHIEYLPQNI